MKILRSDDAAKEAQAGDETSADDEVRKGRPDNSIPFGKRDPVDDVARVIKRILRVKRRSKLRSIERINAKSIGQMWIIYLA